MVAACRLAGIGINNPNAWRWSELPWHFLMIQAWGTTDPGWNAPSWSVSAEWFAYLLFPIVALVLIRARNAMLSIAAAIAALAATALAFKLAHWPFSTVGMPALARVLGEFICGAALCRALALMPRASGQIGDLLGIAGIAFFVAGASAHLPNFALIACLAIAVLGAAAATGPLARVLSCTPVAWLGEISYSLYMVHMPVLLGLRRVWEHFGLLEWHSAARILALLATVAANVLVGAAMFYLVEWPARTRLRDSIGKLPRRPPA